MKIKYYIIAALVIMSLVMILPSQAFAGLGDTDVSAITIQNVSGNDGVSVTVIFIAEDGTQYTPTDLGGGITNPFNLDDGDSVQVYTPNIPSAQLPGGSYAVVVSSTDEVIAVVGNAGIGTSHFVGSYTGFSSGATTNYLATVAYNYYGWYGMISVMNLGSSAADITVTITCQGGSPVGTLSATSVPSMSEHTFELKSEVPSGFTGSTQCIGSAVVTGTQEIAVVNNQNIPASGQTNTYEAVSSGSSTLFVPQLQNNYYGWSSALNIRKLGSGTTTVTIDYDDSEPDDTCVLTDASPSCQLYIPSVHPTTGRFGAKITSSPSMDLIAVVGQTNGTLSGAYRGVGSGSTTVGIPLVQKYYYGWITAVTCQNVSTTPTTLNVKYEGYTAYDTATTLNEGETEQILVFTETILPTPYRGSAVITANASGAEIACMVGASNPTSLATDPGDWTNQYNAFGQ